MEILAAAAILAAQDQPTKTYEDKELGLSFQYPEAWRMEKDRLFTRFEIPLASGATAEVRLFKTTFSQKPEDWQNVQADVADSIGRTIDRQWQEVILGVPLLLTKTTQGTPPESTLTGLLYTATEKKMHYRLNTPADQFDEAKNKWSAVLNSLRTASGDLPTAEDPSRPRANPEEGAEQPTAPAPTERKVHVLEPPNPTGTQVAKGKQAIDVSIQGIACKLFVSEGWRFTNTAEGWTAHHPDLSGSLSMSVAAGTAQDARRSTVRDSAQSLQRFSKVERRYEPRPKGTKAGALLATIERTGEGDDGWLRVIHASGSRGNYYWKAIYRSNGSEGAEKDVQLLNQLFDLAVVEPAA